MSGGGGFLVTFLGLTALEAVLSSQQATGRVTGATAAVANVFQHLTDPNVPAIPDRRTSKGALSTLGISTTTPTAPTTTTGAASVWT